MEEAYDKIFDSLGIVYKKVLADTGAMGGLKSLEYQAISDIGEDTLVVCSDCSYASNLEVAIRKKNLIMTREAKLNRETVHTPNVRTIDDLKEYFVNSNKIVKTLIVKSNDKFYACMLEGARELNLIKVGKLINDGVVEIATDEEVLKITGVNPGFVGPFNIDIPIIADDNIYVINNFVVGATREDYHYMNVNYGDLTYYKTGDITNVVETDKCPVCNNDVIFTKGIEIGNIFKLGTKYSDAMDIKYVDKDNKSKSIFMGCYGLGVERVLASVIEQNNDEYGMILPSIIAPYQVSIVVINMNDEKQAEIGNSLYDDLIKLGVEVLLDDRSERAGVKFNDMDLIGIPYRITVGNKIKDGIVEFKKRTGVTDDTDIKDVIKRLIDELK